PVSTTTPPSPSSESRCSASSMASSMGPESAFSRSGRFMVSSATPSLMVSSSSVVIGDSFGRWDGSRSGRSRQRSHVSDQRADLVVRQMIAEGGHTRPADGRPAVLDQVEHVVVRERRYRLPVLEIARPDEKYGGAPRAMAVGAVTGRAVREVGALHGSRVLGYGVRQQEEREHAAADEEETGRQDDEQPFRPHARSISRRRGWISAPDGWCGGCLAFHRACGEAGDVVIEEENVDDD